MTQSDPQLPPLSVQLNGEPHSCPPGLPLAEMLREAGFNPEGVVVEVNGAILPRPRWSRYTVADGDVLEVVTIVGGGS